MNFRNILNSIAEQDPEVYERTSERRHVLKSLGRVATLAAVPLALGSLFKKAYGQGASTTIINTLKFALKLEYLESEFYKRGASNFGAFVVPPSTAAQGAIQTIRDHEIAHVAFLRSAIQGAGGDPGAALTFSDFDFTADGSYPTVFTDFNVFLAVAQAFEDTGVRAYKGQAGNLMSDNTVLTAALQIHSVEARHASHIRYMRMKAGSDQRPWITLSQTDIPGTAAVYAGEDATTQAGVNIVNIGGQTISAGAASEAFDEVLTEAQVNAIVAPFLA